MMWIDDLREELRRRQALGGHNGEGLRQAQAVAATDEAVARADTLVRTLYNQLNDALLGGRGSVWDTPAAWGVYMWELWWEPMRERGPYLVVTLMRDSRGTAYLKVRGRRLILEDPRIERRLRRALRAAFLEPLIYTSMASAPAGVRELPRPASSGIRHAGDCPPTHLGSETSDSGDENGERASRPRRRGRRNGREDS